MKDIVCSVFGVLFVLVGFYLGGFDFNERGALGLLCYVWSAIGGVAGYSFSKAFK